MGRQEQDAGSRRGWGRIEDASHISRCKIPRGQYTGCLMVNCTYQRSVPLGSIQAENFNKNSINVDGIRNSYLDTGVQS